MPHNPKAPGIFALIMIVQKKYIIWIFSRNEKSGKYPRKALSLGARKKEKMFQFSTYTKWRTCFKPSLRVSIRVPPIFRRVIKEIFSYACIEASVL